MALSIKSAEADELARLLTEHTRESLTEAVTVALRERLHRVSAARVDVTLALNRLCVEFHEHAADHRTADDIIGYDTIGLSA